MTTTRHTLDAEIKVSWPLPGTYDESECAYPKVRITYSYLPGSPGCGHGYSHGGIPPDPAELMLIDATLLDGDGLDPEPFQLKGWADGWLDDAGYERACERAESERCRLPVVVS